MIVRFVSVCMQCAQSINSRKHVIGAWKVDVLAVELISPLVGPNLQLNVGIYRTNATDFLPPILKSLGECEVQPALVFLYQRNANENVGMEYAWSVAHRTRNHSFPSVLPAECRTVSIQTTFKQDQHHEHMSPAERFSSPQR